MDLFFTMEEVRSYCFYVILGNSWAILSENDQDSQWELWGHVCHLFENHWRGKTLLFLYDSHWFSSNPQWFLANSEWFSWFSVILVDSWWFSSNSWVILADYQMKWFLLILSSDSWSILSDSQANPSNSHYSCWFLSDSWRFSSDSQVILIDSCDSQGILGNSWVILVILKWFCLSLVMFTDSRSITSGFTDSQVILTHSHDSLILKWILSNFVDSQVILKQFSVILADSQAILSNSQVIVGDYWVILVDSWVDLADSQAILVDCQAILTDSQSVLLLLVILTDSWVVFVIIGDSWAILSILMQLSINFHYLSYSQVILLILSFSQDSWWSYDCQACSHDSWAFLMIL